MKAKCEEIAVHFGEMWLKGRNRGTFVKKLRENVEASLKSEDYGRLENARDRFIIHLDKKSDAERIMQRLGKIPGISWFAPVFVTGNKKSEIIRAASGLYKKGEHVRIDAHRSYKRLDYNSMELIGDFLRKKDKLGFVPDRDAEKGLYINIAKDKAYLYREHVKGLGGLPVGTSGRAVVLLSGGIDSPVASVYAMKRGLQPIYLHVHAFPDNAKARNSKMKRILSVLAPYAPGSKVYYVPSHLFQATALKAPHQFELVLFKRFLYRLAEKIADDERAETIVTGESLGQVASQTVKNLIATEKGSGRLLMRPLIGFDKQEIVDTAKRLGTYELSVERYPDVCSIHSRNPSTAAMPKTIDRLYKELKLDNVVKASLKKSEAVELK